MSEPVVDLMHNLEVSVLNAKVMRRQQQAVKAEAERDRLRAAIEDAIRELEAIHVEGRPAPGRTRTRCVECQGIWPCPEAEVADDLRAALEGEPNE